MSDVEKYIAKRKKTDPEFAEGFEEGYKEFEYRVLTMLELSIREADAIDSDFVFAVMKILHMFQMEKLPVTDKIRRCLNLYKTPCNFTAAWIYFGYTLWTY